jgi:hypothetical protein
MKGMINKKDLEIILSMDNELERLRMFFNKRRDSQADKRKWTAESKLFINKVESKKGV